MLSPKSHGWPERRIRSAAEVTRRRRRDGALGIITPCPPAASCDLLFEAQGAEAEKTDSHRAKHQDIETEFTNAGPTQDNRPLQFDIVRRRQDRTNRVENRGHRFARKDKPREED